MKKGEEVLVRDLRTGDVVELPGGKIVLLSSTPSAIAVGSYPTEFGFTVRGQELKKAGLVTYSDTVRVGGSYVDIRWKKLTGTTVGKVQNIWLDAFRKADDYLTLAPGLFSHPNLGSDPEIFVQLNGALLPAWQFLKSKQENNRVYWDGAQAEFRTDPLGCLDRMVNALRNGLTDVRRAAKAYNSDAELWLTPVVMVDPAVLATWKKEHAQFGCAPSLNAYGKYVDQVDALEFPYRPAGGHIHLGNSAYSFLPDRAAHVIKMIDAVAGVLSVGLFEGIDLPERRLIYGRAGEYRMPAHGLEYRTLSCAWLSSPAIAQLVVDLVRSSAGMGMRRLRPVIDASDEEVQAVINETDVAGARKIIARNHSIYAAIFKTSYRSSWGPGSREADAASRWGLIACEKGIGEVEPEPLNLPKNWNLNGSSEVGRVRWSSQAMWLEGRKGK